MTFLTHKSPKHTIVSILKNHFHYKFIKSQLNVQLADFYFDALGANGLRNVETTVLLYLNLGAVVDTEDCQLDAVGAEGLAKIQKPVLKTF